MPLDACLADEAGSDHQLMRGDLRPPLSDGEIAQKDTYDSLRGDRFLDGYIQLAALQHRGGPAGGLMGLDLSNGRLERWRGAGTGAVP